MGWCHEFGPMISATCEHPMTAGETSCTCTVCGTSCTGRFAGCAAVWARGPKEVAVDAPRLGFADAPRAATAVDESRWRLPLDPMPRSAVAAEPVNGAASAATNEHAHDQAADYHPTAIEPPDITARFAVAQLAELNDRVEALTKLAAETTTDSLQRMHAELRRIVSMREVDLTEQAAGIFGAVQASTEALDRFTEAIGRVTGELSAVLEKALGAVGGTQGLAEAVADAQEGVLEVREEFAAAFARVERDLSVMRQRIPAKAPTPPPARISDEQIAYIVDAVTENVLAALAEQSRRRR